MNHFLARATAVMLIAALSNAGCATLPRTPPMDRRSSLVVTRLTDLQLPPGTDCLVKLTSGDTVRGTWEGVTDRRLALRSRDEAGASQRRSFDHADIAVVARIVKMSKDARGWMGAAIAAAASLPFGISMVGDMIVPAGIVGALIGRRTGDSHAEIVFERQQGLPIR